jgi:hypothetical protein
VLTVIAAIAGAAVVIALGVLVGRAIRRDHQQATRGRRGGYPRSRAERLADLTDDTVDPHRARADGDQLRQLAGEIRENGTDRGGK